jgi:hypothetical protein
LVRLSPGAVTVLGGQLATGVHVCAGSVRVFGRVTVSGRAVKVVALSVFDQPVKVVDAIDGGVVPLT